MRPPAALRTAAAALRTQRWRRWVGLAMAFNLALGMGLSVVLLRHAADARRVVELRLALLDGRVSMEQAMLWRAASGEPLSAGAPVAVAVTSRELADTDVPAAGRAALEAQARGYQADVARVRDLLRAGRLDAARTLLTARLDPEARTLHATLGTTITAHRAVSRRTGQVADGETLFMMVFAAAVAGLLFRRFDWARRSADLRAAAERARGEARFRSLVHQSSDLISITDLELTLRYQTPSVTRLLGYRAEELAGTVLTDLVHPDDRLRLLAVHDEVAAGVRDDATSTARIRHRDGSWRYVETIHTNLLADPAVDGIVLTTRDVTEQKKLHDQLTHNAFHDALTGLANRALLTDRLQHALASADRGGAPLAVLFVDVDDFKAVNDDLGHAVGDALLIAVADRLRGCVRSADTVARLGGDEFAILVEDTGTRRAEEVAERIRQALRAPVPVADTEVTVAASVGIAVGAGNEHDAEELLRNADVAMYAAKDAGKNRAAAFHPEMDAAIVGRLRLKTELQHALEAGEFTVHYQPTVDLESGDLAGVEALLRWQHPSRGMLPPIEFIPLAEQTGLIVPLGRFVLREACRQTAAWQAAYPDQRPLTVGVNLSARELAEPGLVNQVRQVLADTGLPPACLTLEVTETLLMVDLPAAAAKLAQLRKLGVRLAIDDFGTGYSSLNYLEQLPVHVLKIDKSFVDRLVGQIDDGGDPVMVAAISRLAHALNLELVAEGIEQPEQVTALRNLACHLGQGYYFAKPLPPDQLDHLLHRGRAAGSLIPVPAPHPSPPSRSSR